MIYEIRTYGVKVGSLGEVEKRYGEAYEHRKKYSELAAFFHTEIGPLNEIIHIWKYESMDDRAKVRAAAAKDANWPPKIQEFITTMSSEIVLPFPFAPEPKPGTYGPYYEFRYYTFRAGTLPDTMKRWEAKLPGRLGLSPVASSATSSTARRTSSSTSGPIRPWTPAWPHGRRRWPRACGRRGAGRTACSPRRPRSSCRRPSRRCNRRAPMAIEVDLYSDTVTKPTAEMRRFMCEAEVGDEQKHEDPTVNLLQDMVAELLGKDAALFLPSGTMCNEIAMRVHCRHGEEMLAHRTAHPIHFETGGPAALAGINVQGLDGPRGQFDFAAVEAAIRPDNRHMPRSRLLWVEQTSNLGGGSVWPLEKIRAVVDVARRRGLSTHMDGARLMNAVVASGISAQQWAAPFDSAWIDFTKGLGAPVGAAIAGSREFITEAWRCKQQMGGAMRQAGIIAAGGVYALRHHVKRLADDHSNSKRLAEGLATLPGISLDPTTIETNIVFFDLTGSIGAPAAVERLLSRGIRVGAMGQRTIRAVTHLDVSAEGIDRALEAATEVFTR
ncbi:MAG TPA: GntG family PLP-dependent aldolase [Methylomirabilota bacterium]|nr:GntG family PLP-dependent aldolase [Methylomirabilota bacterium]